MVFGFTTKNYKKLDSAWVALSLPAAWSSLWHQNAILTLMCLKCLSAIRSRGG